MFVAATILVSAVLVIRRLDAKADNSSTILTKQSGLRILTFNLWNSGGNVIDGRNKIVKHILAVNADVVAIQESYQSVAGTLAVMLGRPWMVVDDPNGYTDAAILTRYEALRSTTKIVEGGIGVKIRVNDSDIYFVSLHLAYSKYGPYAANNKLATRLAQVVGGEETERVPQIHQVIVNLTGSGWLSDPETPVFVCGDFNAPSHRDWVQKNEDAHGDWIVEWPVTHIMEENGFVDSYRQLHPDPIADPGITWSTTQKFQWDDIPEPQDRIDFIFYKGNVTALTSATYCGSEPLNEGQSNDYPSDHYALYTDFRLASAVLNLNRP